MLRSRVCGSIPKKYLAGRRGPFCCEQRIPDPDRARDCPRLIPRGRICPILKCLESPLFGKLEGGADLECEVAQK
jgi:hypothetical protein